MEERFERGPGQVSVSTAVKLIEKKFDGDPRELSEFIENVENAYSVLNEIDHPTFFKFVLSKITGDAKQKISDLPDLTWEDVKERLEIYYSVKRTLEFYANKLSTSKQAYNENVSQWGSRVEALTSDLAKSTNRLMTGWSLEKKSGGLKIIAELGKAFYVQGLFDDKIRMMVRAKGEGQEMKQLIQIAVEEESAKRSGEQYKTFNNNYRKPMSNSMSRGTHHAQFNRGGGVPVASVKVKQEPGVHAVTASKCYRCQRIGHVAKYCRVRLECRKCNNVTCRGHGCNDRASGNRQ